MPLPSNNCLHLTYFTMKAYVFNTFEGLMKHKFRLITVFLTLLSFGITINAQETSQTQKTDDKFQSAIISALISASVALVIGLLSYFHNRATLRESKRTERRKVIETTLNEFYGPLLSYLNVIKALYRLFTADKPKSFRTLTYLLNQDQEYETEFGKRKVVLSDSDRKLLQEIIETEKKIEDLIITKGGLADDPALMFDYVSDPRVTDVQLNKDKLGLLAVTITHFRVLRMAFEGNFQNEVERFKDFVYPRELDEKVMSRIESLRNERNNL